MNRTIALLLLAPALAGCMGFDFTDPDDCWRNATPMAHGPSLHRAPIDFEANSKTAYADMGFDGTTWPDLTGHEITVLDHGAFDFAFDDAKAAFEALTGATVTHHAADDAGTALQLAIQDQQAGGGTFDVLYGIDNVLMTKAQQGNVFDAYTPLLAERVASDYRFVPIEGGAWLATPVDMGYIAVNIDMNSDIELESLDDLVEHADQFVTQDPRFSSPGLGFLVATVATYGEDCYLGYWKALNDGGLTVTSGWTEAYEDRFSGGYGVWIEGSRGDKEIVTSYSSSPAYEVYYEGQNNRVLLDEQSAFQQVQTMGILRGGDRVASEAWIEFTLTDAFQKLAAPNNAIYPVVENAETAASVHAVFGDLDPEPGSFIPVLLSYETIGTGIDGWVQDWVDLQTA